MAAPNGFIVRTGLPAWLDETTLLITMTVWLKTSLCGLTYVVTTAKLKSHSSWDLWVCWTDDGGICDPNTITLTKENQYGDNTRLTGICSRDGLNETWMCHFYWCAISIGVPWGFNRRWNWKSKLKLWLIITVKTVSEFSSSISQKQYWVIMTGNDLD